MTTVFKTWTRPLNLIINSNYFKKLIQYLEAQYNLSKFEFNGIKIYPEKKNVFKCFKCDFNKLKVVIIGKEPFMDHSGGLAFDSNWESINLHPTAEVIRHKIENEFYNGFNLVHDFTLEYLMEQHVLLLNESLTVTNNKSHKELWKEFIVAVIEAIQNNHTGIVFCIDKTSELINLINLKTQYLITFENPSEYEYNPNAWDFKFQTINDILEQNNGKEHIINF